MSTVDGIPEFFVSRLEHVEDMGNGNARFWWCVERTGPDGIKEHDTMVLLIVPITAIPAAVAMRQAVFGKTSDWPVRMVPPNTVLSTLQ